MKQFPLFLTLDRARVLIVGGAESAAQKFRLLSRTTARISIMAPDLVPELSQAVSDGRAEHIPVVLDPSVFQGARLVVTTSDCPAFDASVAALAKAAGALVNAVDRPALSDFIMPAIVDRDPVVVAIGTEGTAPVLARQIKTRVEQMLEPGLGGFAALLGRLRARVAHRIAPKDRRRFWEWVMAGPRQTFADGDETAARADLERAIETSHVPDLGSHRITIIDPPAEADLLALRAVARLQTADLILHDPECPGAVLDLARRDAERTVLGQTEDPARWQAERGARLALARAADGAQVVWLSGPSAIAALRALGTDAEIIPSASAPALPVIARAEDG